MKKPVRPLEELLDSVREIEGFPIGKDEDILALSDPPYYTACPNPYINDFIEEYGKPYDEATDDYHREPFVGDVSEGKNDPIYNAHSYHTKVPHKAIMKYIQHYTNEGDIVLDGFCGTGMTGVAAQLLNRRAILSDLSPIATFIAYNYNNPADVDDFENEAQSVLKEVEKECGWMYETQHMEDYKYISDGFKKNQDNYLIPKGTINYTVWSDVFICPYCNEEYVFSEVALEKDKVLKKYQCPNCLAEIKKTDCKRASITFYDTLISKEITQAKQVPVLINYTWEQKRYEKKPDKYDIELIQKINDSDIPYWFPINKMMNIGYNWGDTWRKGYHFGITHVHHFYTKRSIWTISKIYQSLWSLKAKVRHMLLFTFEQAILGMSKLNRYSLTHYSQANRYLSGTLYIGSQTSEVSASYLLRGKIKRLINVLKLLNIKKDENSFISTQSIKKLSSIPNNNSIDYIFTDPPFGDNLMYSELNFLWESWLRVYTNNESEAIINKSQNKTLTEYHQLMLSAFREYHRVLKPKRWITVVFHNSKSSVWNAIQDAMSKAGFIIAHVTILDKKQGTFKQVTASGAVKNDLVISAYKPKKSFETQFLTTAGENLEIDFIKMHLSYLNSEPTVERTEQMLYSKLLAYYVQRSYSIKYDAVTFYKMLRQNFVEEDGYWFNSDQIATYHEFKQKMKLDEIDEIRTGQLLLFVSDEKSAIIWLNAFLNEPKDFQTIHPAYTKVSNISGDNVPDIKELLDKNFVYDAGKYRRPKTEDEKLTVTQKRERELRREFDELLLEARGSKKKIKECRKQAVIFGFEQCYKHNRFQDILDLGKRLDKAITENDSEISEFIEVAELKVTGF